MSKKRKLRGNDHELLQDRDVWHPNSHGVIIDLVMLFMTYIHWNIHVWSDMVYMVAFYETLINCNFHNLLLFLVSLPASTTFSQE